MFKHQCPHPYHQSKSRVVLEKVFPVLLVVGLILVFFVGRWSVRSVSELVDELHIQESDVSHLTKSNAELLKQVDFLESAKKIDQLAENDERHVLTDLHQQLSDAKEQIAFYQRVVSPETLIKGVYIHSFEVLKDSQGQSLRYQMVVAQGSNNKRAVKGKVSVLIKGKQAGSDVSLPLSELVEEQKSESLAFSFRYFQILSADIKLPPGFSPESVVVTLKPSAKKAKVIEKQWLWHNVIKSEPS